MSSPYRNGRESLGVWEPQQLRMEMTQELGISNLGAPTTTPTKKKTWNICIIWSLHSSTGLGTTEHSLRSLSPLSWAGRGSQNIIELSNTGIDFQAFLECETFYDDKIWCIFKPWGNPTVPGKKGFHREGIPVTCWEWDCYKRCNHHRSLGLLQHE